jgi:predicted transposase/invertase (TIGR01784 family)
VATPHDDLFRFTFHHVRHAAAWLGSFVPRHIRNAIDWESLQPAPESVQDELLHARMADLVFHAQHTVTRAPLWFLVEHKSHRDAAVDDQLLRYAVYLRNKGPRPEDRPPIAVLTVLLHHGDAPFAPVPRNDLLAEFQPRVPFLVDDLAMQDETTILARDLTPLGTVCLLCLRCLRGLAADEALAAFDRWASLLRAVDRDAGQPDGPTAVRALGAYALKTTEVDPHELHAAVERILQRPEETIMSTAEKLRNEGIAQGKAETLVLLLTKRFGALPQNVVTRLHAASLVDLDRWTDRILDATSLAEVFAD